MELNLQQNNMNKNKKEKMIDKKVIRFNLKKKMNLLENKFELLINQIKGINKRISTIEEEMEHNNNSKEAKEIIKLQPIMDEIIVANSDAIKNLKVEVGNIKQNNKYNEKYNTNVENITSSNKVKQIKCKYNNRGYCRKRKQCKYIHSNIICEEHTNGEVCGNKYCEFRHPKKCLYFRMKYKCRFGVLCQYLHEEKEQKDEDKCEPIKYAHEKKEQKDKDKSEQIKFQCVVCKDVLNNKSDIIEHRENEKTYHSCLHCEKYAKHINNLVMP